MTTNQPQPTGEQLARELKRRTKVIKNIWLRFMASGLANRKRANELIREAREIASKEWNRIFELERKRK